MQLHRTVCRAVLVLALAGQPLWAGNILGTSGRTAFPRTLQTNLANLTVYGDWIEQIDKATTTSGGISVSIVGKYNGMQNNTGPYKGRGKVDLSIATSNAAVGNHRIRLNGGVYGSSEVTIRVVEPPTVTEVSIPTPAEPFKEIVVTFLGSGLQDAVDHPTGRIVRDNLVNYITVGGNVAVSDVRVLNSVSSNLQLKIFFNGLVQDVSVDLEIKAPLQSSAPLINGLKRRVQLKSANVKNYVKSITFPNGSTFNKNSVATIRLNLLFPAPADNVQRVRIAGRDVPVNLSLGNANRKVMFRFVPADAFVEALGGTKLNANGLTTVYASPGDDAITLTVKVVDCLGGQPGSVNTVKIHTWMHNVNTNQPPEFVEQSFGVRCTQ